MWYTPVMTNVHIKSHVQLTRKKEWGSEASRKCVDLIVVTCNWGEGGDQEKEQDDFDNCKDVSDAEILCINKILDEWSHFGRRMETEIVTTGTISIPPNPDLRKIFDTIDPLFVETQTPVTNK